MEDDWLTVWLTHIQQCDWNTGHKLVIIIDFKSALIGFYEGEQTNNFVKHIGVFIWELN